MGQKDTSAISIEEMESTFFSDVKKISIADWIAICTAFDAAKDEIIRQQKKLSSDMLHFKLTVYPDKKAIDKYLDFSRKLHKQLTEHFLTLPETTAVDGENYPLRSVAFEATKLALSSFIVLHDTIEKKNKTAVFVATLRPFYGHVTLPEFDFSNKTKDSSKAAVSKVTLTYSDKNTESVFHLGFPTEFFRYNEDLPDYIKIAPIHWNKKNTSHETWHLDQFSNLECDFGGSHTSVCHYCKKSLSHLITLPAINRLPISGLKRCQIVTCTGCLGWKIPSLFFSHGDRLSLKPLPYGDFHENSDFESVPLKPATVYLCKTPPKYFQQAWSGSDDQNLHRIGGKPSWVEDNEKSICPQCKKPMVFLMQFDSGLPTIDGKRWLWGSGGVLYIFWCDTCKIDGQVWQCS